MLPLLRRYLLLALSLISFTLQARNIIAINNQQDFYNLNKKLTTALKGADNDIYVAISPGVYAWSERHVYLSGINAPSKSIHIVGNGTILVPSGKVYRNGDKYEGTFSPESSWMNGGKDVEIWSSARYADGQVEVLNEKTKECRIKSQEALPEDTDYSHAYILVTQWYLSGVYKVSKIVGRYIYFVVDNLAAGYKKGYNINNDYNYKGMNPRYKLCNVDVGENCLRIEKGKVVLPADIQWAREGTSNRFIIVGTCSLKSIEFSGIKFWGSGNRKNASALSFSDVDVQRLGVSECEFIGFRSAVMNFAGAHNASVENNLFRSCYLDGISSNNSSRKTVVKGNKFYDMGKRMMNSKCVSCRGANFLVSGNYFEDYGYSGIAAGEWYKASKKYECSGVVEKNTLVYTPDYKEGAVNHGLMDSGAIYLWTKSDGIVIRNNRIDGYSGMGSNRGIFCDDGAYNFEITGNVITGVVNSYCIDSRRYPASEDRNTPGTGIARTNVNNVIQDNIVDGRIRFVGHEDADNGCVYGSNYVLKADLTSVIANVVEHVQKGGEEIDLSYTGEKNNRIGVTRQSYRKLKKSSAWKSIKSNFVRKNK